jgi:redox-sensitive bicupin YhaK (pirin superfamily)
VSASMVGSSGIAHLRHPASGGIPKRGLRLEQSLVPVAVHLVASLIVAPGQRLSNPLVSELRGGGRGRGGRGRGGRRSKGEGAVLMAGLGRLDAGLSCGALTTRPADSTSPRPARHSWGLPTDRAHDPPSRAVPRLGGPSGGIQPSPRTQVNSAGSGREGTAAATEEKRWVGAESTGDRSNRESRGLMGLTIDIRRAESRFQTRLGWLDSRQSFSFGEHYDPDNTHHGLLLVSNDDRVRPATGFGTHAHRDMEIVTWVLSGQLEHHDSEGNHGVLYPGLAQRMSAGTGIRHSEMNPSAAEEVHFVQMWVPPDAEGIAPGYEQRDMNGELGGGGLRPLASGQGHAGAIGIHQRGAVLWGGRLQADETVMIPAAGHAHVFVAAGRARLGEAAWLEEGDAVRLSDADALELRAGERGTEVLIWATD